MIFCAKMVFDDNRAVGIECRGLITSQSQAHRRSRRSRSADGEQEDKVCSVQ
jgi:hypothetical protein